MYDDKILFIIDDIMNLPSSLRLTSSARYGYYDWLENMYSQYWDEENNSTLLNITETDYKYRNLTMMDILINTEHKSSDMITKYVFVYFKYSIYIIYIYIYIYI